MATPFLTSEEYDERAHRLYNEGDYDRALGTLKEGLTLYPYAVELHVGMGYTRLAREEFVWAKQSFDTALVLDPEHEDALVGSGEVLLRFGRTADALELFERVRDAGCGDDLELLLTMGRALYRERLYSHARRYFGIAVRHHADSAEALASLGYTLHRLGDEPSARRRLRRALDIDASLHEARIFLGHLLYDRGEWEAALEAFERVPASEHWDPLAVWRVIELKRALLGWQQNDPRMQEWEARLDEIEIEPDPIDDLLAEIERDANEPPERSHAERTPAGPHRVRTHDGAVFSGTWLDIVGQLRDARGEPGETIAQFMHRQAEETRARSGVGIPCDDPEAFVRASARAGLWRIEC